MLADSSVPLERPSGTVALLFTDVEKSVARWEKHRDAMRAALNRHDAIVRDAIESHGGYVFKTLGDAFCAAFPTAVRAIAAAADAQRAILHDDWSEIGGLHVRMAVHCGAADLRDGDYFGPTVNRVSRLLSIASGGQILVSGIAKDLSEGDLDPRLSLRDLGAHRLRDLAHPEQVYQVVARDLPDRFAPLRSLGSLPNNLPHQLTSFIGRDEDIDRIEGAIEAARLITLVGAGGVGKTRLSVQAGADLLDAFPDGVWFVDLAPVRDDAEVASAIAQAASVQLDSQCDPLESIAAALQIKRLLLILDNCEHVVEAAAQCADAILHACPSVRILTTSRQGLGIAGEHVVRVPSLSVPPAHEAVTANNAKRYSAIALFADRAAAANGTFELTDENAGLVSDICRRLDGIALAIELAAARMKMLSLQQLASRLNERFRLLTGGSRTALPRQQTMRALIDWSYDLLDEPERSLFRRSAVFAGTFSLDGATKICSSDGGDDWDCFDVLSSLVDKSMIATELCGSEQRYRLLESARQYALERLGQAGAEQELRARHASFFAEFAEDAERRYFVTPLKVWLASVDVDADNVRAALEWTIARQDYHLAARIASAFLWYWMHSKQLNTPISVLQTLVAALPADDRLAARCWYALGYLLQQTGQENASRAAATRALEIAEAAADAESTAHALVVQAAAAFMDPSYDGEPQFKRAIEIFTALGNQRMVGVTLGRRARSLAARCIFEPAAEYYERALASARAAGDDRTCSQALNNLAEMAYNTSHPEAAVRYAEEAIAFAGASRNEALMRVTYANMAIYLLSMDRPDDALDRARIALELAREVRTSIGVSLLTLHFAAIAAARRSFEDAAVFIGHFLRALQTIYGPQREMERTERNLSEIVLEQVRANLDSARSEHLMAAGAAMTPDEIVPRMLTI